MFHVEHLRYIAWSQRPCELWCQLFLDAGAIGTTDTTVRKEHLNFKTGFWMVWEALAGVGTFGFIQGKIQYTQY